MDGSHVQGSFPIFALLGEAIFNKSVRQNSNLLTLIS